MSTAALPPSSSPYLAEAINQFAQDGAEAGVQPLGDGNINDTWLVKAVPSPFVLQRLNRHVFNRPLEVVANFAMVTAHLAARQVADRPLRSAGAVACANGEPAWQDPRGEVWRAQTYLGELGPATGPGRIDSLGRILARFHARTADLASARLHVPITGFHCTPGYLAEFDRVCSRQILPTDTDFRYCQKGIATFRQMADVLEEAARQGLLLRRTIHGDPKTDNFIVDSRGEALGLLDLDTVGPGLLPYDLGDCLRSCANPLSEATSEADQVRFDLDRCAALLHGYRTEAGPAPGWHNLLYEGILLVSFELGLRFLTDHLLGDGYFKVSQRGENLHRAAIQFRLVASIAGQEQSLRRLIVVG